MGREAQRCHWRICPECLDEIDWCCPNCSCCEDCCECEEEEDDDDDEGEPAGNRVAAFARPPMRSLVQLAVLRGTTGNRLRKVRGAAGWRTCHWSAENLGAYVDATVRF